MLFSSLPSTEIRRTLGSRQPSAAEISQLKSFESKIAAAHFEYQAQLDTAEKEFAAAPYEKDKLPVVGDVEAIQKTLKELSLSTNQETVAVYPLVVEGNYHALIISQDDVRST